MTHPTPETDIVEKDLSSAAGAAPVDPLGLAFRLKVRLDAILERDGSEEVAITGRGVGISYLFSKQLYAALLSAGGWRPITDADVGKTMLVTNNIEARNAFGEMSHRWITWIQVSDRPEMTSKYVGYTDGDNLLHGLTHCAPLPDPKQEGLAEGLREPQASHPQSRGGDGVREALRKAAYEVDKALENGSPKETWSEIEIAIDNARIDALAAIYALFSTVTPAGDMPWPACRNEGSAQLVWRCLACDALTAPAASSDQVTSSSTYVEHDLTAAPLPSGGGEDGWRSMDSAPRDGSPIETLSMCSADVVQWEEYRACMLGARAGSFGPGWQCVENRLPVEDPEVWRPLRTPTEEQGGEKGEPPPVSDTKEGDSSRR